MSCQGACRARPHGLARRPNGGAAACWLERARPLVFSARCGCLFLRGHAHGRDAGDGGGVGWRRGWRAAGRCSGRAGGGSGWQRRGCSRRAARCRPARWSGRRLAVVVAGSWADNGTGPGASLALGRGGRQGGLLAARCRDGRCRRASQKRTLPCRHTLSHVSHLLEPAPLLAALPCSPPRITTSPGSRRARPRPRPRPTASGSSPSMQSNRPCVLLQSFHLLKAQAPGLQGSRDAAATPHAAVMEGRLQQQL